MKYSDNDLDLANDKIVELEKELYITKDLLTTTIESLKDTQRYLMKLAYNQSEISKRMAQWPYIVVSDKDEK
jgi:hypothetical protein